MKVYGILRNTSAYDSIAAWAPIAPSSCRIKRIYQTDPRAVEVASISGNQCQSVSQGCSGDLFVDSVLMVGCSQSPPDLGFGFSKVENVIPIGTNDTVQPGFKPASLAFITAVANHFNAAAQLANRNGTYEERVISIAILFEKPAHARVGPTFLAQLANNIGVN